MKNICFYLVTFLVLAGTAVVVPETKPGDIYVTPKGDVYQDTGSAIVGPDGVTIRTRTNDQSFDDSYRETMKTLRELNRDKD